MSVLHAGGAALLGLIMTACIARPTSPLMIGRMSPTQVAAVTSKDLCYAYDHGQDDKSAVRNEVARRRLDCAQVLIQAGLEPQGAARSGLQKLSPSGECDGIEFMGVYGTAPVLGIRSQFAKVRNRGGFTRIIEVSYFEGGVQKSARGEVNAGEIESIKLATSDHPVTTVRLSSCR